MEALSQRLIATLLFTAIRDYSRIVNILTLEETHAFLNDCNEIAIEAASKHHGSMANCIGDELRFLFADPSAEFDNGQHAIKCAMSIQDATQEISVKWRHALDFLVEVDIGISTGEILIGLVGSENKQNLPLGKYVTLAAQFAKLCKEYKVNVLLDGETYNRTRDYFTFRKVDDRLILGFTERLDMYTLVSGTS
jgi:adenylate cyclase